MTIVPQGAIAPHCAGPYDRADDSAWPITKYVVPIQEAAREYPHYIGYIRVSSGGTPGWKQRRWNKWPSMWREVERRTGRTVEEFTPLEPILTLEDGGVMYRDGSRRKRNCLCYAAELAARCGAVLVAENLDRFVRPARYYRLDKADRRRMLVRPTLEELELLREITLGVPLATLTHPGASAHKQHAESTKRGLARHTTR